MLKGVTSDRIVFYTFNFSLCTIASDFKDEIYTYSDGWYNSNKYYDQYNWQI